MKVVLCIRIGPRDAMSSVKLTQSRPRCLFGFCICKLQVEFKTRLTSLIADATVSIACGTLTKDTLVKFKIRCETHEPFIRYDPQ